MAKGVAAGMQYFGEIGFVHRVSQINMMLLLLAALVTHLVTCSYYNSMTVYLSYPI